MLIEKIAAKFAAAVVVAAFAIGFAGCNEDPTLVGSSFLADTVEVVPVAISNQQVFTRVESIRSPLANSNSGALFVGKFGNTKAVTMIRPGYIPDSLFWLTAEDIVSAKFFIQPTRYALGDTLPDSEVKFHIHEVTKMWTVAITWDSIFTENGTSDYFGPEIAQPVNETLAMQDTMDKFEFDISKDMIVRWFQLRPDTALPVINHGIALLPDEASNVINRFENIQIGNSSRPGPYIRVVYNKTPEDKDTVWLRTGYANTIVNSVPPESAQLYVQGGITYRTRFYFDVGFIPKFSGIHKAEMVLHVDNDNTLYGNFGMDSVFIAQGYEDDDSEKAAFEYYGQTDETRRIVTFPTISSAVESWNQTDGKGYIEIAPNGFFSQYWELDRTAFHGFEAADQDKWPRLRIIYSYLPNQ